MRAPQAGRYDRLIQFYAATEQDDGVTVKEVFTINGPKYWANVRDMTVLDEQAGGQVQSIIQTVFTLRRDSFTSAIVPTGRIVHDGRTYQITGRKETAGPRLAEVQFTATARNDLS